MWGSIYIESSGTGFPMEFIGDMHDSNPGGEVKPSSWTTAGRAGSIGIRSTLGDYYGDSNNANKERSRRGRGIN